MDVIILEGPNSSGKTTTLQMLYAVLVANKAKFSPLTVIGKKDFEAVLIYNKKKVAIYSMGDIRKYCYNAINTCAKAHIDVLILAFSTKFKSPLVIPKPHTSKFITKTVVKKSRSPVQENVNDCKILHDLI